MEREYGMYFAKFLRMRRKLLGITQEELANRIFVSKSAVTKWESGRGVPDRTNMRALAKELGISMSTINRICEGGEDETNNELIINEIIAILEAYGYRVTKEDEK